MTREELAELGRSAEARGLYFQDIPVCEMSKDELTGVAVVFERVRLRKAALLDARGAVAGNGFARALYDCWR